MEERQAAAGVFVEQRERGRVDARRHAEAAGEAFHELRLARAQVAAEADDEAARSEAAPQLAKRFGLGRRFGEHTVHGSSFGVGAKCS